jgi:hypothetical protein
LVILGLFLPEDAQNFLWGCSFLPDSHFLIISVVRG